MKYKDVLDIEWALKKAELVAKRDWDDVVKWKNDDDGGKMLYEMRYADVKFLREAQKKLINMWKQVRKSSSLGIPIDPEYSESDLG
jgi:hypothetical protein